MNFNSSKFENEKFIAEYIQKISEYDNTTNLEIERCIADINEDFKNIDSTDLVSECNKNIKLYNKYSLLFFEKRNEYIKLEKKKDSLETELVNFYKFDYDKSTKMTDGMVDKYVKAFPMYAAIFELVKNYKNYLELIERTLNACKDRGYAVKNMIEWKKVEFGMN